MANTLRFKRGLAAGIPTGVAGEPLFTTDTFDLYIGTGAANQRFQKYIASGTTSQLLRGDGSLLTMPIVLTSPSNGQVLKYNGTSWVNDSDAGITGSGAAGQVAYFTGATTQTGSNNLFWDATNNRLGIGTNTPLSSLHILSTATIPARFISSGALTSVILDNTNANLWGANIDFRVNGTTQFNFGTLGSILGNTTYDATIYSRAGNGFRVNVNNSATTSMFLTANGRLLLGTTTEGTQRLQVTGDTLMKGSGNTSGTNALVVQNSDGNLLMSFNNAGSFSFGPNGQRGYISITDALSTLGLQTLTLQSNLTISNTRVSSQSLTNGSLFITRDGIETTTVGTDTKLLYIGHRPSDGFAPTSGTAVFMAQVIAPRINQTGSASGVTRGLYVVPTLTAAADWRSIEWSNTSGWGLYGAGSANNHLLGNTVIGSTTLLGVKFSVFGDSILRGSGNTSATTALTVQNSDAQNILRVLNNGEIRLSNLGGNAPRVFSTSDASAGSSDLTGLALSFNTRHVAEVASEGMFLFGGTAYTATSGTAQNVNVARTFSPTSGTAVFNSLQIRTVINQTGGANGITRGLYINPTLTAAADWRSIETSNNSGWAFYGAGSAPSYFGGSVGIGTNTPASSLQIASAATLATGIQLNNAGSIGYLFGDGTALTLRSGGTYGITINTSSASLTQSSTSTGGFRLDLQTLTSAPIYSYFGDGDTGVGRAGTDTLTFFAGGERARFHSTGNFSIGATSDSGQRLQVTGDTLLKGSGNTSATTALTVQNSDGTNLFRVRNDGLSIINGTLFSFAGIYSGNVVTNTNGFIACNPTDANTAITSGFDVSVRFTDNRTNTNAGYSYWFMTLQYPNLTYISGTGGLINVQRGFAPTSGTGVFNAMILNNTINQTGGANGITRGLYVNPTLTAAADWRSIETSNNTGWSYYGAGSANSYFGGSVGIGTTSLSNINIRVSKTITGGVTSYGQFIDGVTQSDVVSSVYYATQSATQATTFTLTNLFHFLSSQGTFGAGSTVTNQFGFRVQNNFIGATNNYGFYGDIASGTGRWNLYMNGTAANYLRGNTAINTTTINDNGLTINQSVNGSNVLLSLRNDAGGVNNEVSIKMTAGSINAGEQGTVLSHVRQGVGGGAFLIKTNATLAGTPIEAGRFTQSQNLHLGTFVSDSGEKLQVNGTMKVTGASTFGGNLGGGNQRVANFRNSGGNGYIELQSSGSGAVALWAASGNEFAIYQNATAGTIGTNVFHITSAANVGISTFTPAYKLDVNGTFGATGAATLSSTLTTGGNILIGATASTVGALNFIKTGTSPVASRLTFGTDGTGYSFAIGKNQSGTITDFFSILDSGAATFTTTAKAAGFITSGGTGYAVINSSSNTVTALRPTGGGSSVMSTNSNGLHIAVGTEANGDLILATNNTERLRLYRDGYLIHSTATNPSVSSTDAYLQYSADIIAGNAAPHFRTENGAVIKLYQETTGVGNAIISLGGGSSVLDDTTFDGYTLRQIVKALRNQGILQ